MICVKKGINCVTLSFGKLNEAKVSNYPDLDFYVYVDCFMSDIEKVICCHIRLTLNN